MRHCFSIATMAEYIGKAAALRMVDHFGGQTLKLPKRPAGAVFDGLRAALGKEAAADLIESFGGEPLYIAMNQREVVEMRRQEVIRRHAAGESFAQIAATMTVTHRFSERWVRKLAGTGGGAPGRV